MNYFIFVVFCFQDIDEETAAFLLSIIGITNTVGRLISGYISDFPAVDSLFVTNVCIAVSGVAVFCVPFCNNYVGFCIASGVFGLFSCTSSDNLISLDIILTYFANVSFDAQRLSLPSLPLCWSICWASHNSPTHLDSCVY